MKVKYGQFVSAVPYVLQWRLISWMFPSGRFPETLDKIVDWVMEQKGASKSELTYALDIGSGNGNVLFALAEAGYPQHYLAGIDYSEDAVKLSQTIAETRGLSGISFSTCDFLRDDSGSSSRPLDRDEWSLILDKGTLDAIALMDRDADSNDINPVQVYSTKVAKLLSPGGLFLITCAYAFNTRFPP